MDFKNDPEYGQTARKTPIYGKLIQECTKCADNECGGVEALMRDKFRVLDGLSRAEFRTEARRALKALRILWQEE